MERVPGPRLFAIGFAASLALVIGIGLTLGVRSDTSEGSTPDLATTTTTPSWVTRTETRIGPAVMVPLALESGDDGLDLSFDVISIAPSGDTTGFEEIPAAPTRLTLVSSTGAETSATVPGPGSRLVTFATPAASPADIRSIRLDGYAVATPVEFPVALPVEGAAWHAAGPGIRVRLVRILEQSENALVVVEIDTETVAATSLSVDGVGREWVSSSGSMLGSANWTLDFRGEQLPDPLDLVVRGELWIEIPTNVELDLSGVGR